MTRRILVLLGVVLLACAARGATITIGLIADTHIDSSDDGARKCTQALAKTQAAVDEFVTSNVDAIIHLGDSMNNSASGELLETLVAQVNGNTGFIPAYWVIGNHDCHSVMHSKAEWLREIAIDSLTGQDSTYFFTDIGNLRLIILDACYKGPDTTDSCPPCFDYKVAYVPDAQLAWLDSTLKDADDSGKFSVVFLHHGAGVYGDWHDVQNAAEVRTILGSHKVIAVFTGHAHKNRRRISLGKNSQGNPIYHIGLRAVVEGDWVFGRQNAYYIASIDDEAGELTHIAGFYDGWGMKTTTWKASVDGANWADGENWTNGVPADGDIAVFDNTSIRNPAGSDQTSTMLTELRIEDDYTGRIGNGSYLIISADTLTLRGGFSDSQIYGFFNVCNASGGAGDSRIFRFGPYSYIRTLNADLADMTWQIQYYKSAAVTDFRLQNGTITTNAGAYGNLIQTGGTFKVCNNSGFSTSIGVVDIAGGTFDAGGCNDRITMNKLIIRGGDIDLNNPNLTITNGIEVYASPTSFSNYPGRLNKVIFKSRADAELTFDVDGTNRMTVGTESNELQDNCTMLLEMDADRNSRIDFRDFAVFAQSWLRRNLDCPE